MSNIFVTGGTGFSGAHLIKRLIELGHEVVTLSRCEKRSSLFALSPESFVNTTMVKGDITDQELVERILAEYDIDTVYHLAAQTIVRQSNRCPRMFFKTNVMGTFSLLEAIRNSKGVEAIHVSSTDKVYGEMPSGSTKHQEEFPLHAKGMYDSSKLMEDTLATAYYNTYGLPIVTTRTCNIYGPADFNPRIVPNTIRFCLKGEPPKIFGELKYEREYIYVTDAVRAYIKLIQNINKTKGRVYNVGSGEVRTQYGVIDEILQHFPKLEAEVIEAPEYTKGEIQYQMIDCTRIRKDIAWQPLITFTFGITLTVDWWKNWSKSL